MTFWLAAKRSKFGNKKTVGVGGQKFDSGLEAARAMALTSMQRAGLVRHLATQVEFAFIINEILVCKYVADFVYDELIGAQWVRVVEDCKSPSTRKEPAYRIKHKLMHAVHGIHVREFLEKDDTAWKRLSRSRSKAAKSRSTGRPTRS